MTVSRRADRGVATANAIVVGVIVVLVAVVALVVKPPAPPGVAAFAPQASKTIVKAPPGQASSNGNGAASCVVGEVCAGTTTTTVPNSSKALAGALPTTTIAPLIAGVPSSLQCYTWPDGAVTQTFDPESPPCVADWPGEAQGNGGATSPGVTATSIRVAYPVDDQGYATWPHLAPIVNFFNTHFEFYGRTIQIVPFTSEQANSNGTGGFDSPTEEQADAQTATTLKVFAATDFDDPLSESWALPTYLDTLAAHHIITVSGGDAPPFVSPGELAAHAPYEWSFYPPIAQLLPNVAAMTCSELVGHPAVHSSEFANKTRKFAVLLPDDSLIGGGVPGQSALLSGLAACGVTNLTVIDYSTSNETIPGLAAKFAQLKSAGVTSLLYFPWYGEAEPSNPESVASTVGYYPEWIAMGWQADSMSLQEAGPKSESGQTFGVADWNKLAPLPELPWYQSFIDGGGSAEVASGVGGEDAGDPFYEEMLMLASGIQAAGPDLTPQTFANGLDSTIFPNPGADGAPFYQARVGFAGAANVMVDDYAGFWLDPTATLAQVEVGEEVGDDVYDALCYADMGGRWAIGTWPSTESFYRGACR